MRLIQFFTLIFLAVPAFASPAPRCEAVARSIGAALYRFEFPGRPFTSGTTELKSVEAGLGDFDEGQFETWRVLFPGYDGYLVYIAFDSRCIVDSARIRALGGKPSEGQWPEAASSRECGAHAAAAAKAYLEQIYRGEKTIEIQGVSLGETVIYGYPSALGYETWRVRTNAKTVPVVYNYKDGVCRFIGFKSTAN